MRKLFSIIAAGAFVVGASVASAAILPVDATLGVQVGTLPPATFTGSNAAASSAGVGGAATLPAGSISGTFQAPITPPLVGVLDGFGVAAPGIAANADFATNAADATNELLQFDGTTGTMSLNASAYLLMGGLVVSEIPLGIVGVGGTQQFHVLTIVTGTINANPYQLGMVTLNGSLNNAPHTLVGTGVDNRTAGGSGSLVLVSPTTVDLGALGSLASLSTLSLNYGEGPPPVPEPGTLLLLGSGVAGLVAIGRRKRA